MADRQWPHNVGPIMSYMTACGSDDCSKFNSLSAEWFKIAELGMNSSNKWYQGYLSMSRHSMSNVCANEAEQRKETHTHSRFRRTSSQEAILSVTRSGLLLSRSAPPCSPRYRS